MVMSVVFLDEVVFQAYQSVDMTSEPSGRWLISTDKWSIADICESDKG